MLKSELLEPICRLVEARPENAEIGVHGNPFVDFWSRRPKMPTSELRELIKVMLWCQPNDQIAKITDFETFGV